MLTQRKEKYSQLQLFYKILKERCVERRFGQDNMNVTVNVNINVKMKKTIKTGTLGLCGVHAQRRGDI